MHLDVPASLQLSTPQTIESWFTGITSPVAFMWISSPLKQYFNLVKPLFQLNITMSNGAKFIGKVHCVSGTGLELLCDFTQVAAGSDGRLYVSTTYPCRKVTERANGAKTVWYNRRHY